MIPPTLKLYNPVDNIHWEKTVSQNFDLGPTFYFMLKKGKLLTIFCNLIL